MENKYIEYYTLTLLTDKEKMIDEYVKDEKIKKEQEKYKERIRELEEELNRLKKQKQEAELEHQRKEKEQKKQEAEKALKQKLQEDEVQRQEQLNKEYMESKLQEDLKREREKEKNSDGRSTEKEKTKKKTPTGTIIMAILAVCIVVGIVLALQNSEVKVGDTVKFGTYDDSDIRWTVLDKEDNKALLITKNCLLDKEYNEEYESVTWKDCTLRNWLNNDFYIDSFSETERKQIVETALNPLYDTEGGRARKDKIFLLSIDEANKYFSSDEERKATYANGSSARWCWLRLPGGYAYDAAYVDYDGFVHENGLRVDYRRVAVRPALWVNLGSDLF